MSVGVKCLEKNNADKIFNMLELELSSLSKLLKKVNKTKKIVNKDYLTYRELKERMNLLKKIWDDTNE